MAGCFSLILVLVALVQWSSGYSTYSREDASKPEVTSHASYSYQSSSTSSSSSYGSSAPATCCNLDKFGLDHLQEVSEFSYRLQQLYDSLHSDYAHIDDDQHWSESIRRLTGKNTNELDNICRKQAHQLVEDVNNGLFTSQNVKDPHFFQWISGNILGKNIAPQTVDVGHNVAVGSYDTDQQQTVDFELPHLNDGGDLHLSVNSHANDQPQTQYNLPSLSIGANHHALDWNKIPSLDKPIEHLPVESNTVTVTRYNRTILTTADGTVSTGSEQHKKWVDGELVYDIDRPLGNIEKWQEEEVKNIEQLIAKNDLIFEELQTFIANNKEMLSRLSVKHNVPVNDVKKLLQSIINASKQTSKTMDWQTQWRANVANMLKDYDFTVDLFNKWASEDVKKFQNEHNIKKTITDAELEKLIKDERDKLLQFQMLKPSEKPTNWQKELEIYLQNISQKPLQSIDELDHILNQNSNEFNKISKEYDIANDEIERWLNVYLYNLLTEGKLQVNNLTAWQVLVKKLLNEILQKHPHGSVSDLQHSLKSNRQIQLIALLCHTPVEKIEEYVTEQLSHLNQINWEKQQEQLKQDILQKHMEKEDLIREYNQELNEERLHIRTIIDDLERLKQAHNKNEEFLQSIHGNINEKVRQEQTIRNSRIGEANDIIASIKENIEAIKRKVDYIKQELNPTPLKNTFNVNFGMWLEREKECQNETTPHDLVFKINVYKNELGRLIADYKKQISAFSSRFFNGLNKMQYHDLEENSISRLNELNQLIEKQQDNIAVHLHESVQDLLTGLIKKISVKLVETENWISQHEQLLENLQFECDNTLASANLDKFSLQELEAKIGYGKRRLHESKHSFDKLQHLNELLISSKKLTEEINSTVEHTYAYGGQSAEDSLNNFIANIKRYRAVSDEEYKEVEDYVTEIKELKNSFEHDSEEIISHKMNTVTDILQQVRQNLEDAFSHPHGSVDNIEKESANYHDLLRDPKHDSRVEIKEFENWYRKECLRLRADAQLRATLEKFKQMIRHYGYDTDQFYKEIATNEQILSHLASKHKMAKQKFLEWLEKEIDNCDSYEEEPAEWKRELKEYLAKIVREYPQATNVDLKLKIYVDPAPVVQIAIKNKVAIKRVKEWFLEELDNLEFLGTVKSDKLPIWKINIIDVIISKLEANDKLTTEDLYEKLLSDHHLFEAPHDLNVSPNQIKAFISEICQRLHNLGQFNNWQTAVRDKIIYFIVTAPSNEQLLSAIESHDFLYGISNRYKVSINDILRFIAKLKAELSITREELPDWQTKWKINVIKMLKERDLTIEDFLDWVKQYVAHNNNNGHENMNKWVEVEVQRILALGLLKPNEELTTWQVTVQDILSELAKKPCQNFDELEKKLQNCDGQFKQLAEQNHIEIQLIKAWVDKVLAKMLLNNELKIGIEAWQIPLEKHLVALLEQKPTWTLTELQKVLARDEEYFNEIAFRYHQSPQQIKAWLQEQLNKFKIDKLNEWIRDQRRKLIRFRYILKIIVESQAAKESRKDLELTIKNFLTGVRNVHDELAKRQSHIIQKDLFELHEYQNDQLNGLQNMQSTLERLFEENSLKQLVTKIESLLENANISTTTDKELFLEYIAAYFKQAKNSTDFLNDFADIDVNNESLESLLDLLDHEQQDPHTHDQVDHKVKASFYESQLKRLLEKYRLQAREQLTKQLHELNSQEDAARDKARKWEQVKNQKLNELKERFEHLIAKMIDSGKDSNHMYIDEFKNNLQHMSHEIHSWIESAAKQLKAEYDGKMQKVLNDLQTIIDEWIIFSTKQNYLSVEELKDKFKNEKRKTVDRLEHLKGLIISCDQQLQTQIQSVISEGKIKLEHMRLKLTQDYQSYVQAIKTSSSRARNALRQLEEAINELLAQFKTTLKKFMNEFNVQAQKNLSSKYIYDGIDMKYSFDNDLVALKNKITDLLTTEGDRLKNIFNQPHGPVTSIDAHMDTESSYLQNLADRYNISVEILKKWARKQLENAERQKALDDLKQIIKRYGLTFDECKNQILNHQDKLQDIVRVNISDVQNWLLDQINILNSDGFFNEPKEVWPEWRHNVRDRLSSIAQHIKVSPQDFDLLRKIQLTQLADKTPDAAKEIERVLEDELLRLQILGQIEPHEDDDIRKDVNQQIIELLQNYKLTVDDLETKLLERDSLSRYNFEPKKVENAVRQQCQLLKQFGLNEIHIESDNNYVPQLPLNDWLTKQNGDVTQEDEEKEGRTWTHITHDYDVQPKKIYNTNTLFAKIGQSLPGKGLIYSKVTEGGSGTKDMGPIQQLIADKLKNHQALSIDEVRNSLSAGSHYGRPQIQLENFSEQQHQSYDYYTHQKLPVDNSFDEQPFKVEGYLNSQGLPVNSNFGQSLLQYGQQQGQADGFFQQPQWSVKTYREHEVPAVEARVQVHDPSNIFTKSSRYYGQ